MHSPSSSGQVASRGRACTNFQKISEAERCEGSVVSTNRKAVCSQRCKRWYLRVAGAQHDGACLKSCLLTNAWQSNLNFTSCLSACKRGASRTADELSVNTASKNKTLARKSGMHVATARNHKFFCCQLLLGPSECQSTGQMLLVVCLAYSGICCRHNSQQWSQTSGASSAVRGQ